MTRLQRLKREAQASATWRGHKLGKWQSGSRNSALAVCLNCQQEVQVIPRPMPNEIEIGGEAIAGNCRQWYECLDCGELLSQARYAEGSGLCPPCLARDKWNPTHAKKGKRRNG